MHSDFVLSRADGRPMYLQIMEQVQERVAVGDWRPGREIPSIRRLAVALQVSVITVKRAYAELQRLGVIVTRQGKGSFVADDVDLGTRLREKELDAHLEKAVKLAGVIGLDAGVLERRLREVAERKS